MPEDDIISLPLNIAENVTTEFRMHTKLLIWEVSRHQTKQDKDGSIRRTAQPISKTICAFLNTAGGKIYIGVDDFRMVRGVRLSKNMIQHFFGSFRAMCEQFKPINPMDLIKISIAQVIQTGNEKEAILRDVDINEPDFGGEMTHHAIGGTYCDCFKENDRFPTNRYLITIYVKAPKRDAPTVIFQNEEGLVYRRRLASNKCVYLDDLRLLRAEKKNKVFVDLHDEIRHEIDKLITF
ncbi:unnamed protein product [Caenorhabditis angaria]|uniref:Schlafen AlbA-2 domain-containing protein n=1 Tax=Caenorhabditis angaria TaxID=860376 RepID=A0A9P1N8K1_9PELO|nr:unnamed protein product [Caenorhabditis angaria]